MAEDRDLSSLIQELENAEIRSRSLSVEVIGFGRKLKSLSTSFRDAKESISETKKEIKDTSKEMDGLSKSAQKTSSDVEELSQKTKASAQNWKELQTATQNTTKFLGGTAAVFKDIAFNMGLPMAASEKLHSMFSKSFTVVSQFQNSIYLSSQKLSTYSTSVSDAASAQNFYNKSLQDINSMTYLSTQESEKMMGTIIDGFKGIRTEAGIGTFKRVAIDVANMNMEFEKSKAMLTDLTTLGNKYAEVQRAFSDKKYLQSKEFSAWAVMKKETGKIDEGTFNALAQYQKQMRERPNAGIDSTGRAATVLKSSADQTRADLMLRLDQRVTETKFAQGTLEFAQVTDKFLMGMDKTIAALQVSGAAFSEAANVLAGVAGVLGVGAKAIGTVSNKPTVGGIAGAVGGVGNWPKEYPLPIWQLSVLASSGIGGSLGKGAAAMSAGKSLLPEAALAGAGTSVAQKGIIGKLFGRMARKRLLGASGLATAALEGLEAYSDIDYRDYGTSKKLAISAARGGIVGSGTAAGAAVGSMILPGVGTVIGGVAGGLLAQKYSKKAVDSVLGDKGTKQETAPDYRNVEKTRIEMDKIYDDHLGIEKAMKEESSLMGIMSSKYEEIRKQTQGEKENAEILSESYSKIADTLMSAYSDAATASAMYGKSAIEDARAAQQAWELANLAKMQSDRTNDPKEKRDYLIQYQQQMAEYTAKQASVYTKQLKEQEIPLRRQSELQELNVTSSKSIRDLNKEMRMGMSVNYQDQIRIGQELQKEMQIISKTAQMYRNRASAATDEAQRIELTKKAQEQDVKYMEKQREQYAELKQMREGYLEAFQESISNLGAYAKLTPTQGFGHQFFAATPSLGGARSDAQNIAIQEPGKRTLSGYKFSGDYQKTFDKMTDYFDKKSMQPWLAPQSGGVNDQSVIQEAMNQNPGSLETGNFATSLTKMDTSLQSIAQRGTESNPTYVSFTQATAAALVKGNSTASGTWETAPSTQATPNKTAGLVTGLASGPSPAMANNMQIPPASVAPVAPFPPMIPMPASTPETTSPVAKQEVAPPERPMEYKDLIRNSTTENLSKYNTPQAYPKMLAQELGLKDFASSNAQERSNMISDYKKTADDSSKYLEEARSQKAALSADIEVLKKLPNRSREQDLEIEKKRNDLKVAEEKIMEFGSTLEKAKRSLSGFQNISSKNVSPEIAAINSADLGSLKGTTGIDYKRFGPYAWETDLNKYKKVNDKKDSNSWGNLTPMTDIPVNNNYTGSTGSYNNVKWLHGEDNKQTKSLDFAQKSITGISSVSDKLLGGSNIGDWLGGVLSDASKNVTQLKLKNELYSSADQARLAKSKGHAYVGMDIYDLPKSDKKLEVPKKPEWEQWVPNNKSGVSAEQAYDRYRATKETNNIISANEAINSVNPGQLATVLSAKGEVVVVIKNEQGKTLGKAKSNLEFRNNQKQTIARPSNVG